jgi:hypothetical protein
MFAPKQGDERATADGAEGMSGALFLDSMRAWLTAGGAVLLVGCAPYSHYDGSALVPGTSTEAEALAQMGPPDEKVKLDNGSTEWFYALPAARQTYAISFGPDGRFVSSEQRLQRDFIDRIRRGWTIHEVQALLGPPIETARFERQQRDVWTYDWKEYSDYWELNVQFSYDGVVREVLNLRDMQYQPIGPGVFIGGRVGVSVR